VPGLTTILAAASPLLGPAGVALGWHLNRKTARETAREERAWAEKQAVRARQEEAAARLDGRILDASADLPSGTEPPREGADKLAQFKAGLLQAWARSTALEDEEIFRRIRALDMAVHMGAQDARMPNADAPLVWVIHVALRELREALACYQRREKPPPAEFPTARELIQLAHPDGKNLGLAGVRDDLVDRGVTA
jgi:hypothetical protein